MKSIKLILSLMICASVLSGCKAESSLNKTYSDAVSILLSDNEIKVDDVVCDYDTSKAVYIANDIIYYEENKDFTYGEGSEKDAHSQDEADKHIVVHINEAGTYKLSGKLSYGQIAIDLGKEAKGDKNAVVNLVLDGIDINCDVAPAIIFYNVYECGNTDETKATKDVDTSKAGANVIICDDSVNIVNGSYVAKIYKNDSVVLSSDKTKVEDAKKLHKYDGAFYSKMSMNIYGEKKNTGILNINAKNEGLDSELHLTINGGNININSGNDGINTNEDNISVTTINGGSVHIIVNGETGEGDGIDSNGWLVINGGSVSAQACAFSGDAGIDSDKGIHINGGNVIASGSMLDRIEDGGQNYVVFNFNGKLAENTELSFKNTSNKEVMNYKIKNSCSIIVYSSPDLKEGNYTLWNSDKQLGHYGNNMFFGGMNKPGGNFKPDDNMTLPDGTKPQNRPDDFKPDKKPEDFDPSQMPDQFDPNQPAPIRPDGQGKPNQGQLGNMTDEINTTFEIKKGGNMFNGIS